jgi:formylglycine-generating enzyme required for sulfatase activity
VYSGKLAQRLHHRGKKMLQNEPLLTHPDMIWVPGGTFQMGSESFYPEEGSGHPVMVDGFWIDRYTVTNAQFQAFVLQDDLYLLWSVSFSFAVVH